MNALQYTFSGHIRNLRLKFTGKKLLVQGSCNRCGKCCQKINLQWGATWLKSLKKWKSIQKKDPRYERFEIVGRTQDNLLTFSCKSMVDGQCTDYESRFTFCKTYPEPAVFLMGGIFQKECGYSLAEGKPFAKEFKKHATGKLDISKVTRNEYGDYVLPKRADKKKRFVLF